MRGYCFKEGKEVDLRGQFLAQARSSFKKKIKHTERLLKWWRRGGPLPQQYLHLDVDIFLGFAWSFN